VDYAQLGTSDVNGTFVALEEARDAANYYLEMTFDTNKKIAALGNSGEIKTRIAKSNWTNFNEADDHSYSNHNQYLETAKITVYWDGQLVWGEEPEISNEQGAKLVVMHQNKDNVTNNSIKPTLRILNTGNQPVALQDITLRYWFTPESQAALNYNIDYAVINSSNIRGAFQTPEIIYEGAERYFEVGFTQNVGPLNAFSQTGEMKFRINKQDWSSFMESDDFSYRSTGNAFEENLKITGYINGQLVWGEEPIGIGSNTQSTANVISVYPNPATNATTLVWSETIGNVNNLHLVDYMNVSHSVQFDFIGNELHLQFSNLNTGIYMIVGSIDGEGFTHRLIVK
jgi:hypothetical protein